MARGDASATASQTDLLMRRTVRFSINWREITLAPARDEQSAFVWRLRNSPAVRAASVNTDRIAKSEHAAWWEARALADLWICLLYTSDAADD